MMKLIDHYEQYFRGENIVKEDRLKIPLSPNVHTNAIQSSSNQTPRNYSGYS